jgi:deoxyribose-phosphate aldolase
MDGFPIPASRIMQTIAIGADHGGFDLKQQLAEHLRSRGYSVLDCGATSRDPVDYPKIAHAVAQRVAAGEATAGIIIDGAGIGSAMVANKVAGVRAALCYDLSSARNSREHNDANVLTLGARLIGPDLATQIVDVFLDTTCTAERHLRRVAMIRDVELGAGSGANEDDRATSPSADPTACACGGSSSTDAGTVRSDATATTKVDLPPGDDLTQLSEHDVQRVAARIAALMGTGAAAPGGGCGFCQPCGELDPAHARALMEVGADRIVNRGNGEAVPREIARFIDHTLLRPESSYAQIDKLCDEAREYGFASVCVNPCHVKRCANRLRGTAVKVCTVVGFPLGATTGETKALEARRAIRDGAREIDMVINIGALKSGDDATVADDIRRVVDACLDGSAICKVIIETALLTDEEKERACRAARKSRAHFVKTSTGFSGGGATADDVALMTSAVRGAKMGVKASGGIRSLDEARQMIRAGATRLGVSAGVRIIQEARGVTVSDGGNDKY